MSIFFRALAAALMIALPICLALYLWRVQKQSWKLFSLGALAFISAQIIHLPVLFGLTFLFQQNVLPSPPKEYALYFNAVVLGLLAGLFEEVARYLFYRFVIKEARSYPQALMFGTGHGGIEAIILGVIVAITLVQMLALQNVDLKTLPLSADQLALAQKQVAEYWSAPATLILLAPLERIFALTLHLGLSVVVLRGFTQKNIAYLFFAIFWHALINGVAVVSLNWVGAYWTEAIIGGFAILNVIGLIWLRRSDAATPAPPLI